MNTPTFIYIRIYEKHIYTGITTNIKLRQENHKKGLTRTTNRFNKNSKLLQIRFTNISDNIEYEKRFKRYDTIKKLKLSNKWQRWEC